MSLQLPYRDTEDHPRGCGENLRWTIQHISQSGSPPRMRGKLSELEEGTKEAGITPADAGKTCQCGRVDGGAQDHPRGCGENPKVTCFLGMAAGSPPRMRGKRHWLRLLALIGRITPAGAGKTCAAAISTCLSQDHPRRCGENRL